ncbi:MAG: hypothetical protein PHO03_02610 [Candidatus Omnitrophica bacterium]|nr:hypothetical protein [Candidatus Omnitrophota bacterium]
MLRLSKVLLFLVCLFALPALLFAEESITISTYYPSPYGVYNEMRAKRIAIGATYYDGAEVPWEAKDGDGGAIDVNADLAVEGNVGIGTTSPTGPLDVYGTGAAKGLTVDTAGNVGIGTTSPGAKLEVTGQVKITGGSPGAGKVLTSDAVGLASWGTAASIYKTASANAGTSCASRCGGDSKCIATDISPSESYLLGCSWTNGSYNSVCTCTY